MVFSHFRLVTRWKPRFERSVRVCEESNFIKVSIFFLSSGCGKGSPRLFFFWLLLILCLHINFPFFPRSGDGRKVGEQIWIVSGGTSKHLSETEWVRAVCKSPTQWVKWLLRCEDFNFFSFAPNEESSNKWAKWKIVATRTNRPEGG